MSTTRLEHQQEILVSALRRAQGAPVSYAELRDFGVEFPAAVVSKLVLAGIPIERCSRSSPDGRRIVGVRLVEPAADPMTAAPAPDPQATARALDPKTTARAPDPKTTAPTPDSTPAITTTPSSWHAVRVYRAWFRQGSRSGCADFDRGSPGGEPPRLARGPRAAEAAGAAPGRPARAPGHRRPRRRGSAAHFARGAPAPRGPVAETHHGRATAAGGAPKTPSANTTTVTTTGATTVTTTGAHGTAQPSPTPVSPVLATQLESRGHGLLVDGRYADAVPVLQTAVRATGESLSACAEPASSTCLTYAYALYDLGRALRLSGHPAAAVPILERRLQIDNQRPTVEAELQLARQNVG